MAQQPPSGPGPPHYRGFTITLRHNHIHYDSSGQVISPRRDLYLITHNTHKRQTSMPPAGFEPAIPASEGPQTHASDRAATGIGKLYLTIKNLESAERVCSSIP